MKLYSIARNGELPPFLHFLFEIIAQSAHGSAIRFLWMYVEVARKRMFDDFLHFGILSSPKKVQDKLISQI